MGRPRLTILRQTVNGVTARLAPPLSRAWRAWVRWSMHPRDGITPPRIVRLSLVGFFVTVTALIFGVTTATAHANFGPHDATYDVTVNSVITVDAGPLGTLQIPSPLPMGLGVTATIGEIPESLTTLDPDDALSALESDVQSYLQFFAAPEATIGLVTKLLIHDALVRAGWAALTMVALVVIAGALMGRARRTQTAYRLARRTWALAIIATLTLGATTWTTVHRSERHLDNVGSQASAVFTNTPLEGARLTGRLSGVIDTYGQQLIGVYEENQSFYDRANASLDDALTTAQERAEHDADVWQARGGQPLSLTAPDPLGAGALPGTNTDPDDDAYTQPASPTVPYFHRLLSDNTLAEEPPQDDYVTMLVVTDLHCNVGMSPLITTAATRSGASIILNGGDTTINGTDLERFCMDSFASAVPRGAVMVQADGNHDSEITTSHARDAGVITLGGEVVEVHGVRILGDQDPRATRIGQGSTLVRGETYAQTGERLAQVACQEDVDLLLIHTPYVGTPVLNQGCAPLQISGHLHRRVGPEQVGLGIQFVNSTTAGAVEGQASIGPLKGTAQMSVVRFDPDERRFVDIQFISVTPDATAFVGPRIPMPTVVTQALPPDSNPGAQQPDDAEADTSPTPPSSPDSSDTAKDATP